MKPPRSVIDEILELLDKQQKVNDGLAEIVENLAKKIERLEVICQQR